MEKYQAIKKVGEGTYGNVWQAINMQSGEVVAIKRLKKKFSSWKECLDLREVKSLRRMNHPNIVKLKEVIKENDTVYFVFEYMECNLYQLIKDRGRLFSEADIRFWCFQIFQALAYVHQWGFLHRDLKPENLLFSKDVVKLADFGLAREFYTQPPFTEYVSTRWYRAPEILLHSSVYDAAADMWALGVIMAELFTLHPFFRGSSEADQLYKICSVLGTPNQNSWSEGLNLANAVNYQFPQFDPVHLTLLIPLASDDAINLISSLCSWDPNKRPTAVEALQHPFFQGSYIPRPLRPRELAKPKTPQSVEHKGAVEQHKSGAFSLFSFEPFWFSQTGVQGKQEMNYERNDNYVQNNFKQPPCHPPPARNDPAAGYMGINADWICDNINETPTVPTMRGTHAKVAMVSDTAKLFTQLKFSHEVYMSEMANFIQLNASQNLHGLGMGPRALDNGSNGLLGEPY